MNSLLVVDAFKKEVMGEDVDIGAMMDCLEGSIQAVKAGDMSHLEAMLLAQATALQTLFTSFALKASRQQHLPNHQIFMTMAFKAQAQSRATLQTLVDLKCPRQPTFVKQANIAHGAQQVNNGVERATFDARARSSGVEKNGLLEDDDEQANRVDARASGATGRADPSMATMDPLYRPKERRR
ncbi:MAG: hypothetical protein KIT86_03340 [Hydrogenophaga sp.]|uniref:hypothetical protein n=1 Tax=Hydrogenophaga sp. TaxID=1904254 RepID=UPI002601B160|nr:hypothetical protein [Hydrogenophaga sp.]MCW5668669.1 hypothetical protein [Hydrogenophaga sp.]